MVEILLKDKMYRIYEEHSEGNHFIVGPSLDFPGCINIVPNEKTYWGNFDLTMSTNMARALGESLIELADFYEKRKKDPKTVAS